MLNQKAVEIPSLQLTSVFSTSSSSGKNVKLVQRNAVAEMDHQPCGTRSVHRETFFADQVASSTALIAQELNPWSSGITHQRWRRVKNKHQFKIRDANMDRRQFPDTRNVCWDTYGTSGNVFAHPQASSSAPYPQELNSTWKKTTEEPIHMSIAEKWKTRARLRSEMPVRTVSQKFSHLQWRRLFKELWGRPTTTADFGSSF